MGSYWQDSPSTTTPLSAANLNAREDAVGGYARPILLPAAMTGLPTGGAVLTAFRIYLMRFVMPRAGTLAGIAYWVVTASGNYDCGVYDTGDATAGSRTLLFSTGSTAVPASGAWREFATPNLTVTQGQNVDIALQVDNATASIGRVAQVNTGGLTLPTNYLVAAGGASPKLIATGGTLGALGLSSTITEATVADAGNQATPVPVLRLT